LVFIAAGINVSWMGGDPHHTPTQGKYDDDDDDDDDDDFSRLCT